MKKHLLMVIVLSLLAGVLLAQQANPQPTTGPIRNAEGILVDTEVIEIRVEAMAPVSGIYKSKSDTFQATGKYRFVIDDRIVQENSEILLNKWLKESK
ncbi:MAG: hypothetical protein PHO85_00340 [Candidatus Cloacimonetes bacterium]|jgi:hypothetical protein|nr:hypothetical protein [Candidatus Cloacimonadota bacterium]MDD2505951.1 hypothetical protein [Candidatus Cloacimonadota bacterium]MDD4146956.1 hypothetical protein [Candidatus Cloacimonadota bacterium]MDD4559509.1 hypothetical protein [Candidatus Cloacimonadota bacterium]